MREAFRKTSLTLPLPQAGEGKFRLLARCVEGAALRLHCTEFQAESEFQSEGTPTMQRWIKLPDGRFIDANRVAFIGKAETFARFDENGNDLGIGYSVYIGTDFPRESQISVTGSKEEVFAILRSLLGNAAAVPPAEGN